MILLDIKCYLKERKRTNLWELSLHFQRDPEIMRDMLSHWLRKGVVVKMLNSTACGVKCIQCETSVSEVYLWARVRGIKSQ